MVDLLLGFYSGFMGSCNCYQQIQVISCCSKWGCMLLGIYGFLLAKLINTELQIQA